MRQPRFLVIQLRQIGDVLISTTLCETLKKSFPHSQVDYCVYPYAAAMALNNPSIDHVLIIPNGAKNNALWKLIKNIIFMRKQKYDYAIEVLNTPKSINLARLSGAKTIIGRATGQRRARHYDIAVSYAADFLADVAASDSVKNRLALLSPVAQSLNYVTDYKIYLTATELTAAKENLISAGVDFTKPLFFFSLSSRTPQQKQWPLPYFIETINTCIKKYDAQIITAPGANSIVDDESAKSQLEKPNNFFMFASLNLREAAAIISYCNLFIGNDSGPRHMAIGVGTPSVAIFSPQLNHYDWDLPGHVKHRSVTLKNILKLTKADYIKFQKAVKDSDIQTYYAKITPELVLAEIDSLYQSLQV
jgi:heptosyltransferase-2